MEQDFLHFRLTEEVKSPEHGKELHRKIEGLLQYISQEYPVLIRRLVSIDTEHSFEEDRDITYVSGRFSIKLTPGESPGFVHSISEDDYTSLAYKI